MKTTETLKIIEKGCDELVGREHLETLLRENRILRVKFGMDPTAPDLHLGHAVVLRKLRQMQDLGHKIIIVLGDATAQIGDPSGRSKTRKPMTHEEVLKNAATYQNQLFKILDKDKTEVRFNAEWLSGKTLVEVVQLLSTYTVAQMLERDDFHNRFSENAPIGLHEFMYPLMQGYDSVALEADIELGGTDQRFNILVGRTLQKHYGQVAQAALFMPLLEGVDGKEKMSKSLQNHIGIFDAPNEMFVKVMKIPDDLILKYFTLCTDLHPDEIGKFAKRLEDDENPRTLKILLAKEITTLYHCFTAAEEAQKNFETVYQLRNVPDKMPELRLADVCIVTDEKHTDKAQKPMIKESVATFHNEPCSVCASLPLAVSQSIPGTVCTADPLTLMTLAGFCATRSEARRLIRGRAVAVNDVPLVSEITVLLHPGDVIRCGKSKFVRMA